ncbi:MAG: ferritin [Verrucomicrobiales bacterium]
MAPKSSVQAALNIQIKNELQAHYTYLGMSAHFESTPYLGFAKWMRIQSTEEYGHAMKIFDYLIERNSLVELSALEAPNVGYGSRPIEVFQMALENEQTVTRQIHDLYELAQTEKDYATLQFLTWFLQEQVEEENTVLAFIERLALAGDDPAGLLRLDDEASRRAAE